MTETAPPETPPASTGASPGDSQGDSPSDSPGDSQGASYQVFARKYRPSTFAGLIGQDAMVRTLTNAIRADRLAQAYILTGVRGIGKTSTARIIARALNCTGVDGEGGPTPEPCGECENCRAITEDRHVDVLEMDAASHTGVDNIREVIDGVRYRPTTARFKIYIIDEVHMLSKQAFNALLKTLEEPPEHVKFIFATTEIRKVPVTVLSRCQRFDLRRVDMEALSAYFADIAGREGAEISDAALHLIVRAADGSVRDGLSLLDQAISHAERGQPGEQGGEIGEDTVRGMLGLADRSKSFMLLEAVLAGDVAVALDLLDQLYREGADPLAVLGDLLEITHWLTRIKVAPDAADAPEVPEMERVRGKDLEGRLTMAALARAWQMLLKGLQEVRLAPSPIQAAEMILVRLAHAAELPTPEEAIRGMSQGQGPSAAKTETAPSPAPTPPPTPPPTPKSSGGPETAAAASAPTPAPAPAPPSPPPVEARLTGTDSAPVAMAAPLPVEIPGEIPGETPEETPETARAAPDAPGAQVLPGPALAVSNDRGDSSSAPTGTKTDARNHPLVKAVMKIFPGSSIDEVRDGAAPDSFPAPDPEDGEPDGESDGDLDGG